MSTSSSSGLSNELDLHLLSSTSLTTRHVCSIICDTLDLKPTVCDISSLMKRMKNLGKDLTFVCRLAYCSVVCKFPLNDVELSLELLHLIIPSQSKADSYNLIECTYNSASSITSHNFVNTMVQNYFAALYLTFQPLMHVFTFTSTLQSLDQSQWKVLEFYFGLVGSGLLSVAKDNLFYILSYISQSFNCNFPFVDNHLVLLMLRCLHEAEDDSLSLQAHYEILKSQTFSYNINEIHDSLPAIAYYLTSHNEAAWKIYCTHGNKGVDQLTRLIKAFERDKHRKKGCVVVEDKEQLTTDPNRIIITLRSKEYVKTEVNVIGKDKEEEMSLEKSATVVGSTTLQQSNIKAFDPLYIPLLSYGHLSTDQYIKRKKIKVTIFFNLLKDLLLSHLQVYSSELIKSQYRKDDHNWFLLPLNMRHDFYEAVLINPIIPLHWAKVQQPNGSMELEDKYRSLSSQRYQSPTAVSAQNAAAELVILNSSQVLRLLITPPTGEDPALIPLYINSDDCSELGIIGCDFLLEEHFVSQEIRWKPTKPFQINKDEQVVRELPLPSNRDSEPKETSAAVSSKKELPFILKDNENLTPMSKAEYTSQHVSSEKIKHHTLAGHDTPGYCIYSEGKSFIMGEVYTVPTELPHTRVIREGGNGLILEVTFEGATYAVKKTALRWREILIMPKLHHPNVLNLISMMIGYPIDLFPRQRHVFHFYSRMTNDLGRSVGSYERFCLRSLNERYKNEPLLLKKIDNNFKHLFSSILKALDYLHTLPNPVIHRDVKPSNVLIKMSCGCQNPLICVCVTKPQIMLSDFDASLELNSDNSMKPDPPKNSLRDFHLSADRTYHVSPVGTIGFKSPEGFMYMITNDASLLGDMTTKTDIFRLGHFYYQLNNQSTLP
ncbi:PREDICTED: uncharacterized protein LOC109583020 isoform X2 [Amphimedon queenslandica]|uniref:Protein kinase domain-containing protein n=1 Tax=Amphimedon queenslandica TaxID=400682 RepID=A0AAN0JAH9_AMPQE|nr:PREDICTED: uncharacterized protein LOC109583020 isoform X2 [Amphimedon queenslandica]|eukprot:XP_019853723.1 PREDICTED: uncharacterized protein LOC109583020 isoform X2 [Amphimedon queenslandica]